MNRDEYTINLIYYLHYMNNMLYELLVLDIEDQEVSGSRLLAELQRSRFEGVSGHVSFDSNGDRLASYEPLGICSIDIWYTYITI